MKKIFAVYTLILLVGGVLLANSMIKLADYRNQNAELLKKVKNGKTNGVSHTAAPLHDVPSAEPRKEIASLKDEIEFLRKENSDLKRQLTSRPSGGTDSTESTRTKLNDIKDAKEAITQLWTDLGTLRAVKSTVPENEYSSMVIDETARFLRLSASAKSSFTATASSIAHELKTYHAEVQASREAYERSQKEQQDVSKKYQEALAAVTKKYEAFNKQYQEEYQNIMREYEADQKAQSLQQKIQALQERYGPTLKQQQEEQQAVYKTFYTNQNSEYHKQYRDQSRQMTHKYSDITRKAEEQVKAILTMEDPRHQMFSSQTQTWLKYLVPSETRPLQR